MAEDAEDVGFDPEALLATLLDGGVEFVVIGGIAAGLHGSQRHTQDLDIVPAPGRENAARLAQALGLLNARIRGVDGDALGLDPTDPETLGAGANWTLTTDRGDLDLMPNAEALPEWSALAARAERLTLGDLSGLLVVGRDDLIALKRAAGRRQDIEDIVQITQGDRIGAELTSATVHLTASLATDTSEQSATEAAELATSPIAANTRIWLSDDAPTGRRTLNVMSRLDGATPSHAETWASVLASKLGDTGLFLGPPGATISTATD